MVKKCKMQFLSIDMFVFLLTPVFNNQLACEGLNKKLRKHTHVHTHRGAHKYAISMLGSAHTQKKNTLFSKLAYYIQCFNMVPQESCNNIFR